MKVLEQGNLKITGAEGLGTVEEACLHEAFGSHGILEALVWLLPDRDSTKEKGNWEGMPVSLSPAGAGAAPVFSGLVQRACFRKVKGRPAVWLEAASYTVLLDKGKKNRSFQKESRTHGELVGELLTPYGGTCIWGGEGEDAQVGRFLMQYKESDWQFLCRVASLQGNAVIPEVRFPGVKLYIGVPGTAVVQPLEADAWRIRKSLAKTPGVADNGGKGILSGGTELLVEGRYEDHCLGDAVSFHGERFIITGKESRLAGGLWVHDYALRREGECHVERICSPWLAGAAVKGTVLGTTLTCSRLALETDGAGEEAESEHIQPVYYAGGGKGYSGQPEKGDTQYLYFPTMREEDRYIVGCVDAGAEQIEAILETARQETEGDRAGETVTPGDSAVAAGDAGSGNAGGTSGGSGGTMSGTGNAAPRTGSPAPGTENAAPRTGNTASGTGNAAPGTGSPASGAGEPSTPKNWSTPGRRSMELGETGVKLFNTGKGRVTVTTAGIWVSTTGSLELEALGMEGHGQKMAIRSPGYVWMHSGDSGILLTPEGIQVKSAELELKSPGNLRRGQYDDDLIQQLLEALEEEKKYLPPYAASDGSVVRREGFNDILYSDEMLRYFDENVYGTGEYNNTMGQPYDLFYQCWLDEVYGRSEAKKFWDHMSTLDGLQDALDVVGFVWDGADVINMVISLCRGEPKEALTYLVCAIPVFGSFLRKGGKWLKSAGMDLVTKGIGKGEELVSSLRVTYRVTADKVAGMQKYLDDVFEQMAAGRMGNGQYRLCFAGGYLDDSSRFMYEIYDDAGETLSRISRMDEMADPKVLKELGGTGHLDDADDILSAAKGLDGTGGEIKVDNYVRVNGGGTSTLNDWVNRIPELEKQAPIEIPSNATVKVQAKNGYDQISFKWTENGQNYEVRWHTKTPGAPEGQGNTWVVSRVTPGTPTGQVRTEHILVGDTWIPRYQWQDAINAYRNGTATQEQLQLLKDGHWQAP